MKIVEPNCEYWEQINSVDHVARVAHTCYMSEDKGHEANEKFYNNLIKSGHYSPLRHESCYYIIPINASNSYVFSGEMLEHIMDGWGSNPWIEVDWDYDFIYAATNAQFVMDYQFWQDMEEYKMTPQVFKEKCPELMRYTFCLTTQISTSRELNRHPQIAIMEMSTRYIKFGGKVEPSIVRPYWMNKEEELPEEWWETAKGRYIQACNDGFCEYEKLLELGLKPQDARGVLPLDTMTKVIYTGSVKQWRHVIDLRYYGTTGAPHGNAKVAAGLIRDELVKLGYTFE